MRRKLCLLLILCLSLTGCGLTVPALYDQALFHLGAGEYAAARQLFEQLNGYGDAHRCALYCAALEAVAAGETQRARADFLNLGDFLQSRLWLRWLEARQFESQGLLDEAQAAYQALGSFHDSAQRAGRMEELIPKRDYAAACAHQALGDWLSAWELFTALGAYEDSADRARLCQEKMFEQALRPVHEAMVRGDHAEALALLETPDIPLTEWMCAQLDQLRQTCGAALTVTAGETEP